MANTSRPAVVNATPALPAAPVRRTLRLGMALFVSFFTHGALLALLVLVAPVGAGRLVDDPDPFARPDDPQVIAEAQEALPRERFDALEDVPFELDSPGELTNDSERRDKVTIPGIDDPRDKIGARDGSDVPPISVPPPPGFGSGTGAASMWGPGALSAEGIPGGGSLNANPFTQRLTRGNSASSIESARQRGATLPSEAAVARGLQWLVRHQTADGRWLLDGMFKDKGSPNDVAATGLGLLPFLGAGKTHKPGKDNAFDKVVARGLRALIRGQDKRGNLGGGAYGHGIGTIALCEAYGLTQDPNLRVPAQRAVNYIVFAQHDKGGWRYSPGQEGDLSVTGWQVMALKSAQMAGLDVPAATLKRVDRFLDSVLASNEGYGYIDTNPTPPMSAVGLLCRQFMHGWGPKNLRLIKGIDANVKTTPPFTRQDAYYHYYATQVMYHFGGDAWKTWNAKMQKGLVETQDRNKENANYGSWSATGDAWGASGGRLMVTSLNLLTLEVYYRYLPLYYREVAAK